MRERDWLEEMFIKSIEKVAPDFDISGASEETISKLVEESFPSIVEMLGNHIETKSNKILKRHQKQISDFKKRLLKRWKPAFDLLEIFIAFNLEYGEIVSASFRKKDNNNVKFETLLRLHARSCQIASEVLELIKGGFADGAMARWRSLYEISIISNFIKDKPEEVCQRYLDHSFVESYYEMIEYKKNCELLGYQPLSQGEVDEIEYLYNEQKRKYGEDFVKNYGWIGEYLPKKKWTFVGIEESIDFTFMRPYYKMANNFIHSGAKGFLYKLGTYNQQEIMLAGPSDYGFADPGQNAAYSLFQTTLTLSEFEIYLEDSLYIQIGLNLLDSLSEKFVKIQSQMEPKDE